MARTVDVPESLRGLFDRAEEVISAYFGRKVENAPEGRIDVDGERYVLVRAASLSIEFFDTLRNLYQGREEEALAVARNLLFHLSHSLGQSDARLLHRKLGLTEPWEKLSVGPPHFARAGWAFVQILPESRAVPSEDYCLVYDHPYSFESASWIAAGRTAPFPVCVMNTGYSAGWCQESFGLPLVATEILCAARGDPYCRFLMAPPTRLEQCVREYLEKHPETARRATTYELPGEFKHKQLHDRLRFSEQKYCLLFENAPSAVFSLEEGRIGEANRAAAALLGLSSAELRGRTLVSFGAPRQQGTCSPQELASYLEQAVQGKKQELRWACRNSAGETVQTEITLNRIEGSPGAVLAVVRDITERLRAEQESRRLEAELRQLQKIEALGTLASGVAHDFNNLLASILCNLEMVRRDLPTDSRAIERLRDARAAADRASSLVRQLLSFSRTSEPLTQPVDANAVVRETGRLVREMVDDRIRLELRTTPQEEIVIGDSNQLVQAVMNLVLNARDALVSELQDSPNSRAEGQTPQICIEVSRPQPNERLLSAGHPPGQGLLCIAVTDNGVGMDETTQSRAFDPFFTTKPVGQGTGLGLTVVYTVAKRHSGWVDLRSTRGKGTSAIIYLPIPHSNSHS